MNKTVLILLCVMSRLYAHTPTSFTTERTKAERVTVEHMRYLQEILTNPEVRKAYYNTTDAAPFTDMQAQMKLITDQWEAYGYGLYIIFDKNNADFIGFAGFHSVSIDENAAINCLNGSRDLVEAYALFMPQYWCKGYGKELMSCADQIVSDKKLITYIDPRNTASLALIKKSAFKEMGTVMYNGEQHILYVYDVAANRARA